MKTLLLVSVALAVLTCTLAREEKSSFQQKTIFRNVPRPSAEVSQAPGSRIWNGTVAAEHQFPYYVGVYADISGFCGGCLIHSKWVLTAAHCVDGMSFWALFMGVSNMNLPKQEGREVHVTRGGVRHPDYDSNMITNDVGLIQLMNEVTISPAINTIKLTPPGVSYVGQSATVAGFGIISDSSSTISSVLRYTTMPIVDPQLCLDTYGEADPSQLCLRTDEVMTSSCSGDSGGPLVINLGTDDETLVGCTSFGASRGCSLGYPVGFTNLEMFVGWISQTSGIDFTNV